MKINDLIFTELLKRGYTLEGKTRIWDLADSKLWYLSPSQAQSFLELENAGTYKDTVTNKELQLIQEFLPQIKSQLQEPAYNIVDLGCGDGQKAVLFIQAIGYSFAVRYCPIDISGYMVEKASLTIKNLGLSAVAQFRWNISDFENLSNVTPLLREGIFQKHLLLLLGNTLGNFDIESILYTVRQGMQENDHLLIGINLSSQSEEDLVKPYLDQTIDDFLIQVLEQIGLERSDVNYSARFLNSRIELVYTLINNKTVQHLNKTVNFEKGDLILAGISYRYKEEELLNILQKTFKCVEVYSDQEKSYTLALCRA